MTTDNLSAEVNRILHGDEDSAAVTLFFQLIRRSPLLRGWLWREFGQSEKTRARAAEFLAKGSAPLAEGPKLLAWLAGEQEAYLEERERLRKRFNGLLNAHAYGGLSRTGIEILIRRYQAGNRDFGAFFLLYAWRKHLNKQSGYELRLLRANQVFLAALAGQDGKALGRQLLKAQAYFANRQNAVLQRADYGFADWWKISALLYMLNHPKPCYRTGEFCRHLAGQRLTVDPKDVRAFCKQHGIARDSRVGRPRKL
jgi:hypothetical protein